MRFLITGADGQLGHALERRAVGCQVVALGIADLDVRDLEARDAIAGHRPDVVINCAAITDVDGCETDPDEAFAVNALGARNVALGAAKAGADLIQVSTDYVFDGNKGDAYWEFDTPCPVNAYGASKLEGERLSLAVWERVYVARSAWLYGLGGNNFVSRILELAASRPSLTVVNNEFGSPTFCDDLADALFALAATGAYGTYHLAGDGVSSRYAFARTILDHAGLADYPLEAVDHFPRAARPPAYAPLRNFSAARLGIRMAPWQEGFRRFVERGGLARA
jgi:dTDP-4-dehydrorhamnose reductase